MNSWELEKRFEFATVIFNPCLVLFGYLPVHVQRTKSELKLSVNLADIWLYTSA